ncbi:MAG: hypothetical protein IKR04_04325 [Clostridia bacterium]|nr:hypothetical protein [Clostridia bacterium]
MEYEESENYKKLMALNKEELDRIFSEMTIAEVAKLLESINGVSTND